MLVAAVEFNTVWSRLVRSTGSALRRKAAVVWSEAPLDWSQGVL